jgi:K+-sensing histidine kinase KdpD
MNIIHDLSHRNNTTKPLFKASISGGMKIANSLKSFNKFGTLPIVPSRGAGYRSAVLGIAAGIAVCVPLRDQLNNPTVALALLLVVLIVATGWGRGPGMVASVLGMVGFNFFCLPPVYTLTIADPQNWVALAAVIITASTVGHRSVTAKRRAAQAEAGRTAARLASADNRSLIEASLDPLVTIGHDGKITDVKSTAASWSRSRWHTRETRSGSDGCR